MEIFIELKKHFSFLGIKSDNKSHFSVKNVIIVFLLVFCFVVMSLYIVFESESLINTGNTFYSTTSAALNAITFSSNVLKKSKIFALFKRFEDMIMRRPENKLKMYVKINKKIERWSKIAYFLVVKLSMVTVFMPEFCISYTLYFTTNLGKDAFDPAFKMLMPFNIKTPIGYAITISIQCVTWTFLLVNSSCILCLLAGVCWLLITLIEDIDEDLNDISKIKENHLKLKIKLHDFIQLHSTAKQFVRDFSDIYEIIIIGYYLWSLSNICCSLIMIQVGTSMDTGHPVELILVAVGTFWAFAQMFIFSDLGENVTNRFININDTIYYCDWYSFPIEIQRKLPIIMMSTQKPVIIRGFANLSCTRDAFKKVVNGGFSYFTMIRRIYH